MKPEIDHPTDRIIADGGVDPNKVMRQSLAGTADTCLYRVPFTLDRTRPYAAGVNRALGTGYHAGLDVHYTAQIENPNTRVPIQDIKIAAFHAFAMEVEKAGDTFDWEYQAQTSRQPQVILDYDSACDMIEGALDRYFRESRYWPMTQYKVLGVEQPFLLPWPEVPGWHRAGSIDLILQDTHTGTGMIIGVDHKTAKKKWAKNKGTASNSPQAAFYVRAIREMYDAPEVAFVYDVMGFDGTFERRPAYRSDQVVEVTHQKMAMLAELIDKGGPFPPSPDSFLCSKSYCDYWDECPFGATLNLT